MRRLALLLLLLLPAPAFATLSLTSIDASRTSGYAPLAVHFNAFDGVKHTDSDRTDDVAYLENLWVWDFGDDQATTWSVSGQDRNIAYGPLAIHVFDPASFPDAASCTTEPTNVDCAQFTVTVTEFNSQGFSATTTITIEVWDPDDADGLTTHCFDANDGGGCTSCPTGGICHDSSDADFDASIAEVVGSNIQILFEGGDTFTQSAKITVSASHTPVRIGSYGAGQAIADYASSSNEGWDWQDSQDLAVRDLILQGDGVTGSDKYALGDDNPDASSTHVLFYGIDIDDYPYIFSHDDGSASTDWPEYFFLVDSNNDGAIAGLDSYPIKWAALRSGLLGNRIQGPSVGTSGHQHTLRQSGHTEVVIQHNEFDKTGVGKEVVTIRGCQDTTTSTVCVSGFISKYLLFSYNYLHGGDNIYVLMHAPNNGAVCQAQFQEYSIFEANHFELDSSATKIGIANQEDWVSVRNNFCHATLATDSSNVHCVSFGEVRTCSPGPAQYPNNGVARNNSFWDVDDKNSNNPHSTVQISGSGTTADCYNNLIYAPEMADEDSEPCTDGSHNDASSGGKYDADTNPFAASNPTSGLFTDRNLVVGSGAQDIGTTLVDVLTDWDGGCRPAGFGGDGSWDSGAHELGASACVGGGVTGVNRRGGGGLTGGSQNQ